MSAVVYDLPGPRARRRVLVGSVTGTLIVAAVVAAVTAKLAAQGQFEAEKWRPFTELDVLRGLWHGLVSTIRAAVFSILLALVFGIIFAAGRLSDRRWLRVPSIVVVEFFRAVPVVLLILFVFLRFSPQFAKLGTEIGGVLPSPLASFIGADQFGTLGAVIVALMLYNGSVLAEVFRAGILAVPRGQAEAACAIGLRKTQVMSQVVAPQAARIMLPAIVSQCVVALKDTALGGVIVGLPDLVRRGREPLRQRVQHHSHRVGDRRDLHRAEHEPFTPGRIARGPTVTPVWRRSGRAGGGGGGRPLIPTCASGLTGIEPAPAASMKK